MFVPFNWKENQRETWNTIFVLEFSFKRHEVWEISGKLTTWLKSYSRIVGGCKAGHVPWYVFFSLKQRMKCGGSLINKFWILSAAHCFCNSRLTCERIDNKWRPTYNISDYNEIEVITAGPESGVILWCNLPGLHRSKSEFTRSASTDWACVAVEVQDPRTDRPLQVHADHQAGPDKLHEEGLRHRSAQDWLSHHWWRPRPDGDERQQVPARGDHADMFAAQQEFQGHEQAGYRGGNGNHSWGICV